VVVAAAVTTVVDGAAVGSSTKSGPKSERVNVLKDVTSRFLSLNGAIRLMSLQLLHMFL